MQLTCLNVNVTKLNLHHQLTLHSLMWLGSLSQTKSGKETCYNTTGEISLCNGVKGQEVRKSLCKDADCKGQVASFASFASITYAQLTFLMFSFLMTVKVRCRPIPTVSVGVSLQNLHTTMCFLLDAIVNYWWFR